VRPAAGGRHQRRLKQRASTNPAQAQLRASLHRRFPGSFASRRRPCQEQVDASETATIVGDRPLEAHTEALREGGGAAVRGIVDGAVRRG